ncbi:MULTISPECIES: FeoA family protein [unclassified Microcoleus]|uniref:FeoA family protein n=1 Tax=unclassified Microcoleus TaxID=2642155 RepID=UPI002FD4D2FC
MKQQYSQQNQESNPGHFKGFTFYGETAEASETENSTEAQIEVQPDSAKSKSFPLAMASVGEKLRIVTLRGSEGYVRRLIGMGFVSGTELQIISHSGGSVIVAIGENRIGLGAGMAQKIMCTN